MFLADLVGFPHRADNQVVGDGDCQFAEWYIFQRFDALVEFESECRDKIKT